MKELLFLILPPLAGALLVALALAYAVKRTRVSVRIGAGLLILAGLFGPAAMLVGNFLSPLPQPFNTLVWLTLFVLPSLALIVAASLFDWGLKRYREGQEISAADAKSFRVQRQRAGWVPAAVLALSALLLAKTLHNFYWLLLWDSTYDPFPQLWLALPLLTALGSGLWLIIALPGRRALAGLYAVLVPALIITVYAGAGRIDFRQLTEARARQITQAIETYHARQGRYPEDLRQLIPRYSLSLPGPVIIYGQGWCYQGGGDYYRLGYVDREHWSSPNLIGRLYSAQGIPPDLPALCEQEIASLRALRSSHW